MNQKNYNRAQNYLPVVALAVLALTDFVPALRVMALRVMALVVAGIAAVVALSLALHKHQLIREGDESQKL